MNYMFLLLLGLVVTFATPFMLWVARREAAASEQDERDEQDEA